MNKSIINLMIILFAIMCFALPTAIADEMAKKPQANFLFPLSLQEIEDEAFSDTAAEEVVFPDGLVYIGENAFSGARKLTDVYIPKSTKYIAESAFSATSNFLIHGIKGSYAEEWAKKHRVPFVDENIWKYIS